MKLFAYILTLAAILGLIYQKEWVWLFMRLSFLNILRHKIKGTYKKGLPANIYKL